VFEAVVLDRGGSVDAAAVDDLHGRAAVPARAREEHTAFVRDGIDVEDLARHELFEQVIS
jgi:hypothetical protein